MSDIKFDKLKMQTPDKTQEKIDLISKLFPHVLTETRDKNNKPVKAIDFDLLKQTLKIIFYNLLFNFQK